jgi:hypothetical protein
MKPLLACLTLLCAQPAAAFVDHSSTSLGGYARLLARPDLAGGQGQLGFWNLYGRLLNEGPWISLDPRLAVLRKSSGAWSDLHLKFEGPGPLGADGSRGSLAAMRLTQAYLRAGTSQGSKHTVRVGSLSTWYGDLGLYDMRPARLFDGALGVAVEGRRANWSYLLGLGDAGYGLKGDAYNAVLNAGASLHYRNRHVVAGVGGEVRFEPSVAGKSTAPHATPGVAIEDLLRGEVVERFLEGRPGQEDFFPKPETRDARSYAIVAELGFKAGRVIKWWQNFARFERLHPQSPVQETHNGREFTIYLHDLSDERFQATLGSEIQLQLIPKRLDLWIGAIGLWSSDEDNTVAPSDESMQMLSGVARAQWYLDRQWHLLIEGSIASEHSVHGNRWRATPRSIESNTGGQSDLRGLEYGDLDTRKTRQFKGGLLFSPKGRGLFARPVIRLLYGLQHSNQNNAFGNQFEQRESNENTFAPVERRLHHLVALEAETWF